MNYEVYMTVGEGTASPKIQDVKEIMFIEEAYYFQYTAGEILFIAPQKNVIYIKKQ